MKVGSTPTERSLSHLGSITCSATKRASNATSICTLDQLDVYSRCGSGQRFCPNSMLALELYREDKVSLGRAAEICQTPLAAFMDFAPVTLHRGERQAILLAEGLRADVLLIDEQIGRTIALSRNIPLSGTLGVLERGDRMGFVTDFPQVLQRLKASGFFITESLEQRLLDRHRGRRHHP